LMTFNKRIGSPPATLGPHRPGVNERTWSSASASSNTKSRGKLPVGPEWDQPLNVDHAERTEAGGAVPVQGSGSDLNLEGREGDHSDRRRGRGQSLGASNIRIRVQTFPGNIEGLPESSD